MSTNDHRAAAGKTPVRCAVLTISDSRSITTDVGGPLACKLLQSFGHMIAETAIVPDEPIEIRTALDRWLDQESIDAIVTTGGTGISPRDRTIEVVREFLRAEIEGFGELFRMLSWEQIGAAAMLSRAVGGLAARPDGPGRSAVLFALPGSPKAVELAITRLIGPEIGHLVWEVRKSGKSSQ